MTSKPAIPNLSSTRLVDNRVLMDDKPLIDHHIVFDSNGDLASFFSGGYIPHVYYPEPSIQLLQRIPSHSHQYQISKDSLNIQWSGANSVPNCYETPTLFRRHSEPTRSTHYHTHPCSQSTESPSRDPDVFSDHNFESSVTTPPHIPIHPSFSSVSSYLDIPLDMMEVKEPETIDANEWMDDKLNLSQNLLTKSVPPSNLTYYGTTSTPPVSFIFPHTPSINLSPSPSPSKSPGSTPRKKAASYREAPVDRLLPIRSAGVTRFINKLFYCLEGKYEEVMRWSNDGKAFLIDLGNPKMSSELLPFVYAHESINSFTRQLNVYQFKQLKSTRLINLVKELDSSIRDEKEWRGYEHPHFVRDDETLLALCRPKPSAQRRKQAPFKESKKRMKNEIEED